MIVSIIGSGNMAHHLAMVFEANNIEVETIYSRNIKNAQKLAAKLYDTAIKTDLDFSKSESEIFFLCVSDIAIEELSQKLILPDNSILVHTSGTISLEALIGSKKNNFIQTGVFYPLMTLSKDINVDFSTIPICLESSDKSSQKVLIKLAKKISKEVFLINSIERQTLHLAAVFASNFTNHLWAMSKEIVEEQDLDFDILKPLIKETLRKALEAEHPADVQTGPALRNDQLTLDKHLKLLKEDDDLKKVYKALTHSIQDWHETISH
jgi:predicted short-subunit dehydrogenase-like oxidoreductase (DUF2520 family)